MNFAEDHRGPFTPEAESSRLSALYQLLLEELAALRMLPRAGVW